IFLFAEYFSLEGEPAERGIKKNTRGEVRYSPGWYKPGETHLLALAQKTIFHPSKLKFMCPNPRQAGVLHPWTWPEVFLFELRTALAYLPQKEKFGNRKTPGNPARPTHICLIMLLNRRRAAV
ncbi:MAG: hypothetical protein Q7J68_02260, partial [Thermoplasmata archaeon]|nr:hypothetical protein [Thermoplasmata archaeon]